MPDSADYFRTKGLVKVRARVDGHAMCGSFMAMGGGVHMFPIKAKIRGAIGKDVGDEVTVEIIERLQ